MFGSVDGGGERDLSGRLGRRRRGSRNTGMAAGASPEAAKVGGFRGCVIAQLDDSLFVRLKRTLADHQLRA